jgi:hypothetical protein
MSLVWHMAKKDLRRMALPVAFWLGFIVLTTGLFAGYSLDARGHAASSIDAGLRLMTVWARLIVAGQLFIGYLLAGSLVLEDPLIGTETFWKTRPIANARLLAAKAAASVLLFVIAPVAALAPVWLASGFGFKEAALAGREFALWQCLFTLFAVTIASLARGLPGFLFSSLAFLLAGVFSSVVIGTSVMSRGLPAPLHASRVVLFGEAMALVMAGVLVHQFLTGRAFRSWSIITIALAAACVIGTAWTGDVLRGPAAALAGQRLAERPDDQAAGIVLPYSFTKHSRNGNELPNLIIQAPWSPDGFYAPARVTFTDGRQTFVPASNWGNVAGLRALGFDRDSSAISWQLTARGWHPREGTVDGPRFEGAVEVWRAQVRVMGELPLRVGADFASGASRTRVAALERTEGRLDAIFLEEHDPSPEWKERMRIAQNVTPGPTVDFVDRYFLINRATERAQPLSLGENGLASMNSIQVRYRRLSVAGSEDWNGAALAKVRIERERSFERPIAVQGVTTTYPGVQP